MARVCRQLPRNGKCYPPTPEEWTINKSMGPPYAQKCCRKGSTKPPAYSASAASAAAPYFPAPVASAAAAYVPAPAPYVPAAGNSKESFVTPSLYPAYPQGPVWGAKYVRPPKDQVFDGPSGPYVVRSGARRAQPMYRKNIKHRPSLTPSACNEDDVHVGNDGKLYIVKLNKLGEHKWSPCSMKENEAACRVGPTCRHPASPGVLESVGQLRGRKFEDFPPTYAPDPYYGQSAAAAAYVPYASYAASAPSKGQLFADAPPAYVPDSSYDQSAAAAATPSYGAAAAAVYGGAAPAKRKQTPRNQKMDPIFRADDGRPSPLISATSCEPDTTEIGVDGEEYIVALNKNGVKKWNKCSTKGANCEGRKRCAYSTN